MIIEDVFDYKVIRIQSTNENLYRNEDLTKSVNHVLNMPTVKDRKRFDKGDSHKGSGFTSVGQPYLDLVYLPGSGDLTKWLTQQFLLIQKEFGFDGAIDVEYKRSWANRLFTGGQGLCHNHVKIDKYMEQMTDYSPANFKPDLVGIFYVDVPEGSSDLVFIRNGKDDTYIDDYDNIDKRHLKPVQGELVIHSPEVWHAVSIHNSDLPRNVFVFDIDYCY
jgi:hypothetical protein